MPNYWILKTDGDTYPFEQLERDRRTMWDGITNPLALKHIRSMAPGDRLMIYHAGDDKAIVGLARVVSAPYANPKLSDPKLAVVDVEVDRRLSRPVTLATVKADAAFADLPLVRQPRLSVIPVPPGLWERILELGGGPQPKR
jgi:predicted RNA-binding protein with PUA-like domain